MFFYFAIGVLLDVIITRYTQAIQENKALLTAVLSFIITLLNIFVFGLIILGNDFIEESIAFAFGCAIGSGLTVRYKKKFGVDYFQEMKDI